jgi:hypothetical protein
MPGLGDVLAVLVTAVCRQDLKRANVRVIVAKQTARSVEALLGVAAGQQAFPVAHAEAVEYLPRLVQVV